MRLSQIIEQLNTNEKRQFLNLLEGLAEKSDKRKDLESLFNESDAESWKNAEGELISRVYKLLIDEYRDHVLTEFQLLSNQAQIVSSILSRDGNSVMSVLWFEHLYNIEISKLTEAIAALKNGFESGSLELSESRVRDYTIYQKCVEAAYTNDLQHNLEPKVTSDEAAILDALAQGFGLSLQEVLELNHMVVPLEKQDANELVDYARRSGLLFVQKKSNTIFVPDEVVEVFRGLHGREVADKYYRRVLRLLREPELNLVCKQHGLPMRGVEREVKIRSIIDSGVSFSECLASGMHKPEDSLNDRKRKIQEVCESGLSGFKMSGATIEEKIGSVIAYFKSIEEDESIDIGKSGYDGLIRDLEVIVPETAVHLQQEFQLQEQNVLNSEFLSTRGIKPRDVVEVLSQEQLARFCDALSISRRGIEVLNILEHYRDADNLLLENYVLLAARDLAGLKEKGMVFREAELGVKFEEVTRQLLTNLGLGVDEELRKSINTAKDKADILISGENNEVILIECKSAKDVQFSKFSSLTRQMRSYFELIESKGYRVIKSLLIAPEFSDEFVNAVELEYELNLSLVPAAALKEIHEVYMSLSGKQAFPYKMLAHARDVKITPERIVKALLK